VREERNINMRVCMREKEKDGTSKQKAVESYI